MCQVLMDLVSFVWRLLKPMWISRSKQSLRIKSTNCDPCLLLRDVIEWSIWCLHRQMWRHTIGKTAVPWAVQKCQLWFLPLGKLIDSTWKLRTATPRIWKMMLQNNYLHEPTSNLFQCLSVNLRLDVAFGQTQSQKEQCPQEQQASFMGISWGSHGISLWRFIGMFVSRLRDSKRTL